MTELCNYGCGNPATHTFKNGKHCCGEKPHKCPAFALMRAQKRKEKNPDWFKDTNAMVAKMSENRKGIQSWAKGLTKETDPRIAEISNKLTGIKRSEETKQKVSNSKKGKQTEYHKLPKTDPKKQATINKIREKQKGQKRTGNYKINSMPGELNPMHGKFGKDHPAYKGTSDKEQEYRQTVRALTKQTSKEMDTPTVLIGRAGVPGAHQLDHIVPVSYGYEHKIPAELLASQDNLQYIPWEDNLSKKDKLTERAKQLLMKWGF